MIDAALDTSAGIAFAFSAPGHPVWSGHLPGAGRETEGRVLPWITESLAAAGLTVREVRRWTVGLGPGSFCGIRVGVATVRGICRGTGARLRGLPSSLALAAEAALGRSGPGRVGVLHDARQGQFILTVYAASADGLLCEETPATIWDGAALAAGVRGCDCLVCTASTAAVPVPPMSGLELTVLDHLTASFLLPGQDQPWPEPDTPAGAAAAACEPVYVRPPVFVAPRPVRTPTGMP
jgi:tRNA threonylcarbamoyl adenosine modification protein YeaZ